MNLFFMVLTFKYDPDKDIENYKIIHRAKYKGGESKILELYKRKFGEGLDYTNLSKFIKGLVEYNKIDLKKSAGGIEQSWLKIKDEFFKRMDKIFSSNLPIENFVVYLTTNDRCGYSLKGNYFFVTVFSKKPMMTIMHELLHFYTYYCFKGELEQMDSQKAYDIKESLTELLNLEFSDLLDGEDKGYQQHQQLRQLVKEAWQKKKDIRFVFDELAEIGHRH